MGPTPGHAGSRERQAGWEASLQPERCWRGGVRVELAVQEEGTDALACLRLLPSRLGTLWSISRSIPLSVQRRGPPLSHAAWCAPLPACGHRVANQQSLRWRQASQREAPPTTARGGEHGGFHLRAPPTGSDTWDWQRWQESGNRSLLPPGSSSATLRPPTSLYGQSSSRDWGLRVLNREMDCRNKRAADSQNPRMD